MMDVMIPGTHKCAYRFHLPSTHLTIVRSGVLYSGCIVYNSLPTHIKSHSENSRHFKKILKSYLIEHSVCSLEEYYQLTK